MSAGCFLDLWQELMPRGAASSQYQRQQGAIDARSLPAALSDRPQSTTSFFEYLLLQSMPAHFVSGTPIGRAEISFSMCLKCRDSFSLAVEMRSGMLLHCVCGRELRVMSRTCICMYCMCS